MAIFKGFKNIQYPRYTVVCPQTGFTYDVRTMNVMETNRLKTSLTTPAKTPSLINKTLWESIEDKPEEIKTFQDFKKMTTLRDREALMYGLYHCTFGDQRDFDVNCSSCNKQQSIQVNLSKIFSMNAYPFSSSMIKSYQVAKAVDNEVMDPVIERKIAIVELKEKMKLDTKPIDAPDDENGIILGDKPDIKFVEDMEPEPKVERKEEKKSKYEESILEKTVDLELPISKVHAILRQPTLADEEELMGEIPFTRKKETDLVNETLVIKQFEEYDPGAKIPCQVITNRTDILYGYQTLPPMDKIKIFEVFQKEFGQYGIDLKAKYVCEACGEENETEVDIVVQFFRMVATS